LFLEGTAELTNTDAGQDHSAPDAAVEVIDGDKKVNRFWIRFLPEYAQQRMSGRHNLQAILGNSTWLFLDKIIRMGVGLIVGVWVARYLGPGQFGLLNYAIAFTGLFGAVATLGLDGIVIRELVKSSERRDVILGSAFVLKLIGASIAFLSIMVAITVMRPGQTLTFWVVGLSASALIFQSLNVIDLLFQSRVQSRYTVYATNAAFLLITIVKVGLLLYHAPLLAFAWAALGEIVLSSTFFLVAYRANHMNVWAWCPDWQEMRTLLSASWPLMLTGISIMISMRADQVLIGQYLSDRQVGIYSAAAKIAEIWYFIPLAIAGSTFPLLVESKKQGEDIYYQRLQSLYNVLVLLPIVVGLIMSVLASPIVRFLYGPAYIGSARVLSVLIWSGVPVSFGCAWANWMLLENRTRMMFYFQLATALTNVLLNLVLIPRFGIMGSAYATLISYWFGSVGLFAIMKSQHKALAMIAKAVFPYWLFYRPNTKSTPL
jgi:PST family polysaccharide transporter